MEQVKHTPGPWRVVVHDDEAYILDAGNAAQGITAVRLKHCGIGRDESLANARLIAAAPESHEGNKAALMVLCALESANDWHPNMQEDIAFAIQGCRAAIAKTLGESA